MAPTQLNLEWQILSAIGPVLHHHVVLDVGAHHGWFLHCWLDWCPEAEVHAFEPAEEAYSTMNRLYGDDGRVELNQVGVGSEHGHGYLHVLTESRVSSSFLAPREEVWDKIGYQRGEILGESAPLVTLDSYCKERNISSVYLIKIDVQGFEMEVLRGGEKMLRETSYILVEAGIERLYVGAPSFAEVFLEMERRGFHLISMRAWHRGNRQLVETDMLFRRNDLAPDIEDEGGRYYLELR